MKCFSKFMSANLAPKIVPKWATNLENRGLVGGPIGFWDQKSSKFRSCVLLWLLGGLGGVLGASCGRFGAVLGPSWGRLGPSWVRLGDSGRLLESILLHLGASWTRLAASSKRLAASWAASSGNLGSKTTNHMSDSIFGTIFC